MQLNRWKARLQLACYPCDKQELNWQLKRVEKTKNELETRLISLK